MHIGQTVCSRLPLRVTPTDKQAPPLLGALLGTFSGSICCVSPVWDGLPATALLALQQELGFSTAQHAGLNPISFRLAMLIHTLRDHHPSTVLIKIISCNWLLSFKECIILASILEASCSHDMPDAGKGISRHPRCWEEASALSHPYGESMTLWMQIFLRPTCGCPCTNRSP